MLFDPRHWDGWATMEGCHLVFAYAAVLLIHTSYAVWMAVQWQRLRRQKKAPKPSH